MTLVKPICTAIHRLGGKGRAIAKTLKLLGYWKAVGDDVRNRSRQPDAIVMHAALEVNLPNYARGESRLPMESLPPSLRLAALAASGS